MNQVTNGLDSFNGKMFRSRLVDGGYDSPEDLLIPNQCIYRCTHIGLTQWCSSRYGHTVRCLDIVDDHEDQLGGAGVCIRKISNGVLGYEKLRFSQANVRRTITNGGLVMAGIMEGWLDGQNVDFGEHAILIAGIDSRNNLAILDPSWRGLQNWQGFGGYIMPWETFARVSVWPKKYLKVNEVKQTLWAVGGWSRKNLMIEIGRV